MEKFREPRLQLNTTIVLAELKKALLKIQKQEAKKSREEMIEAYRKKFIARGKLVMKLALNAKWFASTIYGSDREYGALCGLKMPDPPRFESKRREIERLKQRIAAIEAAPNKKMTMNAEHYARYLEGR